MLCCAALRPAKSSLTHVCSVLLLYLRARVCCAGASGGLAETSGPTKVEVGDTNHVCSRLMAARSSSHHDYGHVMKNLELHFSMSEEDERRHRLSTRVR